VNERATVAPVRRRSAEGLDGDQDLVAVEAPLAVTLRRAGRTREQALGVLMRTPGEDDELLAGFLYSEGVVRRRADIVELSFVRAQKTSEPDTALVTLDATLTGTFTHLGRATTMTSACGLCGRLQSVAVDEGRACPAGGPSIDEAAIASVPDRLRHGQRVFGETGGLHAAALFDIEGHRGLIREDVGRHNAVDKVIGAALGHGWLPAHGFLLAVSGRVAYEIVQKAVMAGVPAVVALGAPSSLAVEAARATALTLVGFARGPRFNVYSGWDRITAADRGIPRTRQVK